MKNRELILSLALLAFVIAPTVIEKFAPEELRERWEKPLAMLEREKDEDEEFNPAKSAPWSAEQAAHNLLMIEKYMAAPRNKSRAIGSFANGALQGEWINRGPKNMPGAFKFAELLDGTDTVYGISYNQYSQEFNARSVVYKGTVYNPKTGTKGDDFVGITSHWPNRYNDFIAIHIGGKTRLIAGIEQGSVFWSEDDGKTWTKATGLPSVVQSTVAARLDNNMIYTTDGRQVYRSINGGTSFTSIKDFGSAGNAVLSAPRYAIQNDDNIYLARSGTFYVLAKGTTTFTQKGSYTATGGTNLELGGDKRRLYVTENIRWWVSTDQGSSWSEKYPKDNWYGERTNALPAGAQLGVSPVDPNVAAGGYGQPVFFKDGMNSQGYSSNATWWYYQNGTNVPASQYYDTIRFNYHPDFQASQFFLNASGDQISIHSTDGGIFQSYNVWNTVTSGQNPVVNGYSSDYVNITLLGTANALIYRNSMWTGNKDEKHIMFATQDQGSQSIIPGTSGNQLDFYQSIGGDGPSMNGAGGYAWKFGSVGHEVSGPVSMYDGSGNVKSVATVSKECNASAKVTFFTLPDYWDRTAYTHLNWIQTYVDKKEPNKRIWMLTKKLYRATSNGSTLSGTTIDKGNSNQVAAVAQSVANNTKVWFLQDGKVYKSTNTGDSFDNGVTTPFAKTSNSYGNGDIGAGWVLPGNDNWILFAGPSANSVGAILSKDGGTTWKNSTGDFPYGVDLQVSGMTGTPDGKFVFAGTDLGAWVFVVAEEKWYAIGQGAGYFNTTAVEYIASTNTVRFGTWGAGVWDFKISQNTGSFLSISSPSAGISIMQNDKIEISWSTNQSSTMKIDLMQGTTVVSKIATGVQGSSFNWTVPQSETPGTYTIRVSEEKTGGLTSTSSELTITEQLLKLNQTHLSIKSVNSEETKSENGAASNLIDGSTTTIWHSEYSVVQGKHPFEIVFKADTTVALKALKYLPRQSGTNGLIKGYEIYVSNNGTDWTKVASGEWTSGTDEKIAFFDKSYKAGLVKLVATSEIGGQSYGSGAEVNLYYVHEAVVPLIYKQTTPTKLAIVGFSGKSVHLSVPKAGAYRVELYALNGRLVFSEEMQLSTGIQSVDFSKSQAANQLYLLRISGGGSELKQKIIVR